jgi:GTP-binding protein HflX
MPTKTHEIKQEVETAVIVGVQLRSTTTELFHESMAELYELVRSAEAEVVGTVMQRRPTPDRRHYIGSGKITEIKEIIGKTGASIVVFDDQLSPAQVRNLETELEVKVIDRGNLILDIFAKRARTTAAKLQVELAQLQYLLPRLTRMWSHMTHHVGGIGTRGPGETQLETDRREIQTKISKLKERLEKLDKQRITQRKRRQQAYKVALVGYTNAGKSTIFNHLTSAGMWADDLLFCTLDAVTRTLPISNGNEIVISDTVGFIQKIPHELIASFASTLDEVRYADMLLQVIDISHPNAQDQNKETEKVLTEIGAGSIPRIIVMNKADKLEDPEMHALSLCQPPAKGFVVSARTNSGMDKMVNFLREYVEKDIEKKFGLNSKRDNGEARNTHRR